MCTLMGAYAQKISKNFKVNASEKGNWGRGSQWGRAQGRFTLTLYPSITFQYLLPQA